MTIQVLLVAVVVSRTEAGDWKRLSGWNSSDVVQLVAEAAAAQVFVRRIDLSLVFWGQRTYQPY